MEALRPTDPRQVGRYRLSGRLGSGGMGEVFLGQSPGGRPVAVKLIRSDIAENAAFRARFAQEVAAARRVGGIFTAPVVDADPDAEQPWLVTGYVAGPSLTEAVESRGPLATDAVLSLAGGLAEGLAAIHAAGVVHRDLKPSNVLLAPDGPRIIDFGISRAMDASRLTGTGSIVGSPGFMSPEQAEGGPIGPSSDIFSLGSVITFAAVGECPFGSGPATVLLYRVVHGEPAIDGVPTQIRPLVARSLSKQASLRPTAEEFLAQMSAAAGPDSLRVTGRTERQATVAAVAGQAPAPRAITLGEGEAADAGSPARMSAQAMVASPVPPADQPEPPTPPDAEPAPLATKPQPRITRFAPLATRPRRSPQAILAAVFVAVAVVAGLVLWQSGRGGTAGTHHAATSPQAVVRAFIRDINARDWPAAWRLGGDNMSRSYRRFVTGFRHTKHVVITRLVVRANTVYVRTLAAETTGPVQIYSFVYVVQAGKIIFGEQHLVGIRR